MITLQIPESDWLTCGKYWKELEKHFVSQDYQKKIDFLNSTIFESFDTISSIMTQNDDELVILGENDDEDEDEDEDNNDNDMNIDPTIKIFICQPV